MQRNAKPQVPQVVRPLTPEFADPVTAMTPRFNTPLRLFARRFFRHFDIADADVARLRAREDAGAVVYVMRYASRLDYFLFNALFAREGLALSACANGIASWYFRPLARALAGAAAWLARLGPGYHERTRENMERTVARGGSLFLFLRSARFNFLRARRDAVAQSARELELLETILRAAERDGRRVSFVPLALFWRRGPRSAPRFRWLSPASSSRPSDAAKMFSFLLAYRGLAVKVGAALGAEKFLDEPAQARARRVRRRLLCTLFGEQRAAEGPVLKPLPRVERAVLRDPQVMEAIHREAGRFITLDAALERARANFREIAANMAPKFLAVATMLVGWVLRGCFVSVEHEGFEKFRELTKQHPVVMVPSHRSYFDFLLLSWLLHREHVTPPHIAARDNMAFGPFEYLFRRVGAFFLRQRFDDELYKAVFRAYVRRLVSEGFLQEFFIEGGRSRTGKMLAPKFGMLSWSVQGFVDSGRRDLYFVPISINYERLVEEGALLSELEGSKKRSESTLGLLRAYKVLKHRWGKVFVNFGEPISLAHELRDERALFAGAAGVATAPAQQAFIAGLANKIVERINWAAVASATSVAACALLGGRERGLSRAQLVARMREVVELLRLQDVRLTPALEAEMEGPTEFRGALEFLQSAGLLQRHEHRGDEVLHITKRQWRALDVHRNGVLHYLAAPSLLVRGLLTGATRGALRTELAFWLDFFYEEFFAPKGPLMAAQFDAVLDHFEERGALTRTGEVLRLGEKGRARIAFLAGQTRALFELHHAVFTVLARFDTTVTPAEFENLVKSEFQHALLRERYRLAEAFHADGVRAIVNRARRRGWLKDASTRGGTRALAPGANIGEAPALCARLAAALDGG